MSLPAVPSFLGTSRGRLLLVLLCLVDFLDVADGTIVNIALPSIRSDLGFSVQNLQWVFSGYVLTYGGFLLLGGRLGDLLGRRRLLLAGTALFGLSSVLGGVAVTPGMLIAARLLQGLGAALMTPAALSTLTTSFNTGTDRLKALGVWGAVNGLGGLLAVVLGGLLAGGPGWRWVFFVNPPVCLMILIAGGLLLADDRQRARLRQFDLPGAMLITAAIAALIYGLVQAPTRGWADPITLVSLAAAVVLLAGFVVNERRQAHPLVPFAIFHIKGLVAADGTQVIALAGFSSMFFFVTLYMQTVLGFSVTTAGLAYVPAALAIIVAATVCSKLFARIGTRPLIVAGALIAAAGVLWLSRLPLHGSYLPDLLPGFLLMGLGLGAVVVGVQTAGNAGVPAHLAGLAAALITTSFQLGSALGLAVFSAVATARTAALTTNGAASSTAVTGGYRAALLASAVALVIAAVIALRATNTRGEPLPADAVPGLEEVDPIGTDRAPTLTN